jgi:hypothetical protein
MSIKTVNVSGKQLQQKAESKASSSYPQFTIAVANGNTSLFYTEKRKLVSQSLSRFFQISSKTMDIISCLHYGFIHISWRTFYIPKQISHERRCIEAEWTTEGGYTTWVWFNIDKLLNTLTVDFQCIETQIHRDTLHMKIDIPYYTYHSVL